MSHRSSLAILLAVFVGSLVMQATEPPQKGYPLPEDIVVPVPPREDRLLPLPRPGVPMQQHLRELIPAGDLIGDGIHEIMQTRGSVLDKFPTEEQFGLAPELASEPELEFAPGTSHPNLSTVDGSLSSRSQRARVAEQLLKSARLLADLDGRANRQQKLIDQLRVEARNLLSE